MPRAPRPAPSAAVEATNAAVRGAALFTDDADRAAFLDLVGALPARFGVVVHGVELSDAAYTVRLTAPRGNLGAAVGYLQAAYTRHANRRSGERGALFRGRFAARPVSAADAEPARSDHAPASPGVPVAVALAEAARVTGVDVPALLQGRPGRGGDPAHRLAVAWAARRTGLGTNALARALGADPSAVSRTLARSRRDADPRFLAWFAALEADVNPDAAPP